MENYVDDGTTVNYTNGGGTTIAAGTIILMKNTLGSVIADIAAGATGAVQIRGKVTAPKVSGAAFVVGEALVWDVSANAGAGAFDDSAAVTAVGDVTGAAVAAVAGTDGQTTCTVILTPGNTLIDPS